MSSPSEDNEDRLQPNDFRKSEEVVNNVDAASGQNDFTFPDRIQPNQSTEIKEINSILYNLIGAEYYTTPSEASQTNHWNSFEYEQPNVNSFSHVPDSDFNASGISGSTYRDNHFTESYQNIMDLGDLNPAESEINSIEQQSPFVTQPTPVIAPPIESQSFQHPPVENHENQDLPARQRSETENFAERPPFVTSNRAESLLDEIQPILQEIQGATQLTNQSTQTQKEQIENCNCIKSQCLKMYCICFANSKFCNNCSCTSCFNNKENESPRGKAIKKCLRRNPNVFVSKMEKKSRKPKKRCDCKQTGCLIPSCDCYAAVIPCSYKCRCVGCLNCKYDGSVNIDFLKEIDDAESESKSENAEGIPNSEKKCNEIAAELFTEPVRDGIIDCVLTKVAENPEQTVKAQLIVAMEQYSKCFASIQNRQ